MKLEITKKFESFKKRVFDTAKFFWKYPNWTSPRYSLFFRSNLAVLVSKYSGSPRTTIILSDLIKAAHNLAMGQIVDPKFSLTGKTTIATFNLLLITTA